MDERRCQFEPVGEGKLRCAVCGRNVSFAREPARLVARCPGAAIADEPIFSCRHRGRELRTEVCQLCGRRREPAPIYACALHGECSLRRWRTGDTMPACLTCPDRAAAAPEPLILSCPLSPGDVLTLTAAVESLHREYPGRFATDVRTPRPEIWRHNPHITPIADDAGRWIELEYPTIHSSNRVPHLFLAGYTEHLGAQLNLPLRLTTNRPHVYFSAEEACQSPAEICPELADLTAPFWLLSAGVKRDFTAKQWPVEWYQQLVDQLRGRIAFVQVGAAEHDHPQIAGTIDLRGKTTLRQLLLLAARAQGAVGPVTLLAHAMAAVERPYVAIVGGREPAAWVSYPKQATLHSIGQLGCCADGACWKSRVFALGDGAAHDQSLCEQPNLSFARPVAECMARITPEEVAAVVARIAEAAGPATSSRAR